MKALEKISSSITRKLTEVGSRFIEIVDFTGYTITLLIKAIFHFNKIIFKRHVILQQMYNAGVKSFPVVSIVALFTGMILALQIGIEISRYGQQALVGTIIITTMTREMSPFISAIVLIATVGSAIAAEIATMEVSEEIDALSMMCISPVRFLVMPRLVALSLIFPIVSVYFTFVGALGGGIVSYFQLNLSWEVYYGNVVQALKFKATYVGLLKSYVFGILVAGVCCAKGLRAKNGAMGVGHAVRDSVIASFLLVLIIGYYITAIFYGGKV